METLKFKVWILIYLISLASSPFKTLPSDLLELSLLEVQLELFEPSNFSIFFELPIVIWLIVNVQIQDSKFFWFDFFHQCGPKTFLSFR